MKELSNIGKIDYLLMIKKTMEKPKKVMKYPMQIKVECFGVTHGVTFFNFVVLSAITVPDNFLTPHISKIHLLIVSLNVRELELNWCSKDQSSKKGGLPCVEVKAQLTLLKPYHLLNGAPSFHSMSLPNVAQSK